MTPEQELLKVLENSLKLANRVEDNVKVATSHGWEEGELHTWLDAQLTELKALRAAKAQNSQPSPSPKVGDRVRITNGMSRFYGGVGTINELSSEFAGIKLICWDRRLNFGFGEFEVLPESAK